MRCNLAPGCISSDVKLCQRKPLFPFFRDPFFWNPLFSFFLVFLSPAKVGSLEMQPGAKLQAYLGVIILQPHACTQRLENPLYRESHDAQITFKPGPAGQGGSLAGAAGAEEQVAVQAYCIQGRKRKLLFGQSAASSGTPPATACRARALWSPARVADGQAVGRALQGAPPHAGAPKGAVLPVLGLQQLGPLGP